MDERKVFYSLEITPKPEMHINFDGFVKLPLFVNLTWLHDYNLKTALTIKVGKTITATEVVHSVTCYNMSDSKLDEFLNEESVVHLNVLRGGKSETSN